MAFFNQINYEQAIVKMNLGRSRTKDKKKTDKKDLKLFVGLKNIDNLFA